MRKNSPKQTEASRINGGKSKGAKSPAGKNRVRLNALKDGLFSKDIVIESLGELKKDFKRLKKEMWDTLQPASALEEMLVADIIENWWRRQRVRRAESADLQNRLDTSWIRDKFHRDDEVETLKSRFLDLLRKYIVAVCTQPLQDIGAITAKLEEVRQQLANTSVGGDFLIQRLEAVEVQAREKGQLSREYVALMLACCGFENEMARACAQLNFINVRECGKNPEPPESTKSRSDKSEDSQAEQKREQGKKTGKERTGEEEPNFDRNMYTQVLTGAIKDAIGWVRIRKDTFEYAEQWEAKTRSASSILPAEASDRFLRAETTIERRMYRALVTLLAMRAKSDGAKMLE
ncbi:MAG: hypothetical protein ACRD3L_03995 [Terriglobales bacterium]